MKIEIRKIERSPIDSFEIGFGLHVNNTKLIINNLLQLFVSVYMQYPKTLNFNLISNMLLIANNRSQNYTNYIYIYIVIEQSKPI
jgi:hypothetical protein